MIRIYTISRVLSMGDTMGCGVVSIRVNRHFSRHGKLGPQEGKGLGLVYTSQKAPADNGTLRRGTTSDERKGRPCWRFHCPAWWSNSQENMQINYLQRLTRKLRLERPIPPRPIHGLPHIPWWWSSAQGSVSKGTDVPLQKLLDSFCVGVLLTGDISYLCDMDSLDCLAR